MSLRSPLSFPPPKMIVLPVVGSLTAVGKTLGGGGVPEGDNCVHVGVPPRPLALERVQTSFR